MNLTECKKIIRGKIIKEIFWATLTKGVSLVLFLVLNIYLARKLGSEGFGVWSLFFSIITVFTTISYLGINTSTKKFIAQYKNTNRLKDVLVSSIKLRMICSLFFSILILFFYKPIVSFFNYPQLEGLFLLSVPVIFLSGLVEYLKDVFMGLHRIKYNFIINSLEFSLRLFFVFIFFIFSISVVSIVKSLILSLFISFLVGSYFFYFNFYKKSKSSNKKFTRKILNYSFPLFLMSFAFLFSTEIDVLMIGFYSTKEEVGIYSVAKQLIVKLSHIALVISMGAMPIFAEINKGNSFILKNKFYKILKINSVIYSFLVVSILFLSPLFIPLVFGNDFEKSVLPLQILTFYLAGFSVSILLDSFLDYVGRAKQRALNSFVFILLNILLNILLIPKFGAVGASIAISISSLPYIFLNWLEVRRVFNKFR
jgi:O-antigen/teichoic acid export membrane protein